VFADTDGAYSIGFLYSCPASSSLLNFEERDANDTTLSLVDFVNLVIALPFSTALEKRIRRWYRRHQTMAALHSTAERYHTVARQNPIIA